MKHLLILSLLILIGCSTSPTGRKQLTLLPDSQINELGAQSFQQLKQKRSRVSKQDWQYRLVQCIADKQLQAAGYSPSQWEIEVFVDESPNAFALPGKKIGVHTGMVKFVDNSSQLAAVIGHEIAHVEAGHGNERVSQQLVIQMGLSAAQVVLGSDKKTDQMILAGLGLGAQFGVLLPFSRAHEREADLVGLESMQKAGFDAREAVQLWKKMAGQGASPPQFLSTHPDPSERAAYLQERLSGYSYQGGADPCEIEKYRR